MTNFHHQPATPPQNGSRLRNKTGEHFQSAGAGKKRLTGLKAAHLRLHRVGLPIPDIGRIGNHIIESALLHTGEQIGLMELDPLLQLVAGGICVRDFQSEA